jgi:hypothetical protein
MPPAAFPAFAGAASRRQVPPWPCSRTPPVQVAAAFLLNGLRADWTRPLGQTQGIRFEHTIFLLRLVSITHIWIKSQKFEIFNRLI